tara:strand:- start:95 stop:253 length:159 start_codon:yes stop_codon:yes gene_type:complete
MNSTDKTVSNKKAFERRFLSLFLILFWEKLYLPLGLFATWLNSNFFDLMMKR